MDDTDIYKTLLNDVSEAAKAVLIAYIVLEKTQVQLQSLIKDETDHCFGFQCSIEKDGEAQVKCVCCGNTMKNNGSSKED